MNAVNVGLVTFIIQHNRIQGVFLLCKITNLLIYSIIQSFLILILVVLIIFMMIQISRLQGTARVINYAGLVRGATQREIKLEITGNQNDELIKYLDDILLGLRYQDGHYNLVKLNDEEYQGKLKIQSDYWDKLKTEIEAVRNKGYENTDIVNMSEIYFTMADKTVSAAESYSEKIAVKIRTIELLSALDMLSLVILVIMQTLKAMPGNFYAHFAEKRCVMAGSRKAPSCLCSLQTGNFQYIYLIMFYTYRLHRP